MSEITVEEEARNLGWVPQEDFRGDKERWVDAETFVDKGKHIMPILQKNNERLQGELAAVRAEQVRTSQILAQAQNALANMEERHTIETQKAVDQARRDIKAQLAHASENGDHAAMAELTDQLSQMPVDVPKPPPRTVAPPPLPPDFVAWQQSNTWFGTDKRKTALANGIAQELRDDPNNASLIGRPFWDRVTREVESTFAKPEFEQPTDKVAGARSSGGGESKGSKYSDLPADAKSACDADIRSKVGEGKRYKTAADWRAKYAEIYFGV